jgi:hypothetical protein
MKQQYHNPHITAEEAVFFRIPLWGKALTCFADTTNLIQPDDV